MRKRRKHSREHPEAIRQFIEWQEKQYVSGYWAGGKIPLYLKGPRPKLFGYILLSTGILSLLSLLLAFMVVVLPNGAAAIGGMQTLAVGVILVVLQIAAGLSLVHRKRD